LLQYNTDTRNHFISLPFARLVLL